MNHCRWNLLPPFPDDYPADASGFPPLIVQLMYNRGLIEPAQQQSFIAGDECLANDPYLLPGMHQAVNRIYRALLSGEKIAVYGDYDADGITATALLVKGISILGNEAVPYIPHRMTEGYGLRINALEKLRQQGVSLVITVDCGITSLDEVKKAQKKGLDIIITDHHTPLPEIPPAVAVIDPKLPGSSYPFKELAGVGVAFKLLQALFLNTGKEKHLDSFTDLVAIGTIADISPLLGENRYLVKEGLKEINTNPRPGIETMITRAGLNKRNIDAQGVSWTIAPRLNAAGRLEHGISSYNLLMTESPQEAYQMAEWLERKNEERQKLTAQFLARAREQILAEEVAPILIAGDGDFPLGIVGLIAGRLTEEFYRPSIVIRTSEKVSTGSCRSIADFNIIAALNKCCHLLSHFGGHSQAAGFTLPTKDLPQLQQMLLEMAAAELGGVDLRPYLDIDAEITLRELGGDTFQITQQLAPFGRGNPLPTFLSRGVEVVDCHTMGNGGNHLRLKIRQGGTLWDAVGFRLGNYLAEISQFLDIVYNLEKDFWNGNERLRINMLDFAPSSPSFTTRT